MTETDYLPDEIVFDIWDIPPEWAEVPIYLDAWEIIKAVTNDLNTEWHLVGYDDEKNGYVSGALLNFDAVTGEGTAKSGQRFWLSGMPGFDCVYGRRENIWENWAKGQYIDHSDMTPEIYVRTEYYGEYNVNSFIFYHA